MQKQRSNQLMKSGLLLFSYNLETIVVKVKIVMETTCISICNLNRFLTH